MPNNSHTIVNPDDLAPAVGFAHLVIAGPGRHLFFGGQTSLGKDNEVLGATLSEQFEITLRNLCIALRAGGGAPEHLVQMHIFVRNLAAYRSARTELGRVWKTHLGRHYPALALFEVSALYEPAALVEITAIAVVP